MDGAHVCPELGDVGAADGAGKRPVFALSPYNDAMVINTSPAAHVKHPSPRRHGKPSPGTSPSRASKRSNSPANFARRLSTVSAAKAVQLHQELQDSVCVRRAMVLLVAVALGISVAVAVVTAQYHEKAIEDAALLVVESTTATAMQGVRSVFGTQFGAHHVMMYAMDTGWYAAPLDADAFDQVATPFFVQQPATLAVHGVHSTTKDSMKFGVWQPGAFATELRTFGSGRVQRRARPRNAPFAAYTQVEEDDAYDPTGEEWYQRASQFPTGYRGWEGPLMVPHAGTVTPAFAMLFRHPWQRDDVDGDLVVRLTFSVAALSVVLKTLDVGDHGAAYVVNGEGDLVGAADTSLVQPGSDGRFPKVWELAGQPVLGMMTQELLSSGQGVNDGAGHSVHIIPLGNREQWALVVVLHSADHLQGTREVSSIAGYLSVASIVVLVMNFIKMVWGLVMMGLHSYMEKRRAAGSMTAADFARSALKRLSSSVNVGRVPRLTATSPAVAPKRTSPLPMIPGDVWAISTSAGTRDGDGGYPTAAPARRLMTSGLSLCVQPHVSDVASVTTASTRFPGAVAGAQAAGFTTPGALARDQSFIFPTGHSTDPGHGSDASRVGAAVPEDQVAEGLAAEDSDVAVSDTEADSARRELTACLGISALQLTQPRRVRRLSEGARQGSRRRLHSGLGSARRHSLGEADGRQHPADDIAVAILPLAAAATDSSATAAAGAPAAGDFSPRPVGRCVQHGRRVGALPPVSG